MKFTKKELDFIGIYSLCSDTKSIQSDKIGFISCANSADVIVVQLGTTVSFITVLKDKNPDKTEFVYIYNVNQLYKLVQIVKETDIIEINDNEIQTGSSKYNFESIELSIFDRISLISTVDTIVKSTDSVIIKDLKKLSEIKSYMGTGDLSVFGIFKDSVISSNRISATAIIKTSNTVDNFFLNPVVSVLENYYKLDSITFSISEINSMKVLSYKKDNTFIIINTIDSSILPNLTLEDYKPMYYHENVINVNKADLLYILKKIHVVSQFSYDNRITLSFKEGSMFLESKNSEGSSGKESYTISYPEKLENVSLILSSSYLINMVSSIPEDTIVMRISEDADASAISITNNSESKLFIHIIYADLG